MKKDTMRKVTLIDKQTLKVSCEKCKQEFKWMGEYDDQVLINLAERTIGNCECPPTLKLVTNYLDALRESGVCNMFAAPQYLVEEYNISFEEACTIFEQWISEKNKGEDNER